jgi:hypothetical protein
MPRRLKVFRGPPASRAEKWCIAVESYPTRNVLRSRWPARGNRESLASRRRRLFAVAVGLGAEHAPRGAKAPGGSISFAGRSPPTER